MNNPRIDEAILSVVGERWMKVAKVIVEVAKGTSGSLPSQAENYESIGERIEALVNDGHLLAQGNTKNWRFSEVRRVDAGRSS